MLLFKKLIVSNAVFVGVRISTVYRTLQ